MWGERWRWRARGRVSWVRTGCLTGSAARAGVDDGFIPLVSAGHGEGTLVHAILAAAKHRPARLKRRAAVRVRSAWKTSDGQT